MFHNINKSKYTKIFNMQVFFNKYFQNKKIPLLGVVGLIKIHFNMDKRYTLYKYNNYFNINKFVYIYFL